MERAGLFDSDLDVSGFKPKKAKPPRAPEAALRDVAEKANFQSREPKAAAAPAPKAKEQRRHRTGRNIQINLKIDAETHKMFYDIAERQGWVSGEIMKRALEALQKELGRDKS